MAGNATSPSLSEPTTTSNCSKVIVNSLPFELVEDTGGYIIIVYVYAVLVVVATLALYVKWVVVEECWFCHSVPHVSWFCKIQDTMLRDKLTNSLLQVCQVSYPSRTFWAHPCQAWGCEHSGSFQAKKILFTFCSHDLRKISFFLGKYCLHFAHKISNQFFLAALFSSVSIFLPASHVFSKSVLKVIFGGGVLILVSHIFPLFSRGDNAYNVVWSPFQEWPSFYSLPCCSLAAKKSSWRRPTWRCNLLQYHQ